ncbi:hypothetical protein [Clostridium botulinum]|uniref:hypothetical protein n=1 Tax=Clostridium botulinum TaxID=1491 RepID=UPI00059C4A52|nr:hypothetical protein [Clostridium botulinum]KIN79724.1 hypothetical protein SD74_19275 [Clostridium botulinum]MCC5425986.1 hypothetical protein [Clostridium botulinum]MCC5437712.1 hypothetical protein [Clostridium botulinum]
MDKWTYEISENSDIWRGGIFDSKEEAIKEANSEAIEYDKDTFRIGIIEEVFNYGIDVDDALERINAITYDEVGEVAEDYLYDVTKEHKEELQDKLNEVFYKWQEKYNYKPTFYKVISEEVIEVKK